MNSTDVKVVRARVKTQVRKQRRYNPYRRVREEGGSAVITMGAIIPLNWHMVKVELVGRATATERVIKFTCVSPAGTARPRKPNVRMNKLGGKA